VTKAAEVVLLLAQIYGNLAVIGLCVIVVWYVSDHLQSGGWWNDDDA
jgi:hypothetical protein